MKFIISRTSLWNDEEPPCEEAVREKSVKTDTRTVDAPEKVPAKFGEDPNWWYSEGFNHRIVNGQIKRDFEHLEWFVELSSLEDLLKFKDKHGDLIIRESFDNDSFPQIEIYDNYRE